MTNELEHQDKAEGAKGEQSAQKALPKKKGYGRTGTIIGLVTAAGLGTAAWLSDNDNAESFNRGVDTIQRSWFGHTPPPQVVYQDRLVPVVTLVQIIQTQDPGAKFFELHFDHDEALIGPGETPKVIEILQHTNENPDDKILIMGCADRVGDGEHNDQLADARATNIEVSLTGAGVDPARINKASFGEECALVGPDSRPEQRQRAVRVLAYE